MKRPITTVAIAGTSHVVKTSLAHSLADVCKWPVVSTDMLARHPGRPWHDPPEHVLEYFDKLSDDAVYRFLCAHHKNMAPMIAAKLSDAKSLKQPIILEGAALRPELLDGQLDASALCVCLYASPGFLRGRMLNASKYDTKTGKMRRIIDRFITRSLTDNAALLAAAKIAGFQCVDVADRQAVENCRVNVLAQIEILAPD